MYETNLLNADKRLAQIVPVEQTNERVGCVFEAFGDGFFPDNLARFDQRRNVLHERLEVICVIANDEALHP